MTEIKKCPLCLRPLGGKGTELTVRTTKEDEHKLEFCADSSGCRRTAYALYVDVKS